MLDKAHYIVVEGPIGAGKTSLAKRLAERLQAETLFEQAELNPFLGRFYQQPERWGMATQLSFLFQRIDQLTGLGTIEGERRVVADFLFDKDRLFAEQNLAEDELALYRRVHDSLQPTSAPQPDLVIYLQAPPDTLLARINRRGLEAERRITETYLNTRSPNVTRATSISTRPRRCSSSIPTSSTRSTATRISSSCSRACARCAATVNSSDMQTEHRERSGAPACPRSAEHVLRAPGALVPREGFVKTAASQQES